MCLYDVEERLLLRRFQVSANRSLDGVLDQLNSKTLTDAGPAALIDDAPTDDDDELLPASAAGVRPMCCSLSERFWLHAQHARGAPSGLCFPDIARHWSRRSRLLP